MKQITVTEKNGKFIADFEFDWDTKDLVKKAGFRWDPKIKKWWTTEKIVADRVATPEAINEWIAEEHQQFKASAATDADIDIPAPEGLNYLPYQRAGIAYAKDRNSTLIADEMGLGKTIQGIGIANSDPSVRRVLIVCPASLKLNWQREWRKWDVKGLSTAVADSKWTDSGADVVIINYENVEKCAADIAAVQWDLMILDECHYVKNSKAKRTKTMLGYYHKKAKEMISGLITHSTRKVFLTGTPIVNRPIELWTIVQACDPEGLGKSFFGFAKRYCNAYHNGYGWDFSGASNLDELHERLRKSFMVRRLKSDVLKDLPPKRRSIIALKPTKAQQKAIESELKAFGFDEEDYEDVLANMQESGSIDFERVSAVRRQVALAKIDGVIEQAEALLEETEKLVIMAHHHEVIDRLTEAFGEKAVKLDGRMNQDARQESVDRFQNDPSVKVFVGSIKAAGVGITLTASSTVLFAELDWTPGNMSQAEDRCHRIGQKDMVNIYHVVLDGSVDARVAKILVQKQSVIDRALDEEIAEAPEEVKFEAPREKKAATQRPQTSTQAQKSGPAVDITEDQIRAVHTALRILASGCDYAAKKDEAGFNAFDAKFGHDLANRDSLTPKQAFAARKMIRKYRRQLGDEMMDAMFGKKEEAGS